VPLEIVEAELAGILEQVQDLSKIPFDRWNGRGSRPPLSLLPACSNEMHDPRPRHVIEGQILPEGEDVLRNGQWPGGGTGDNEE
jgi:hypothetical protein